MVNPSALDEIQTRVSNIRSKSDITRLSLDFKPFKVPGTLQSNLASIEKLNPFYEKNMKFFDVLEQKTLLLISDLPPLDEFKNYILKFEWIDTTANIYLNGNLIGSSNNAFQRKEILLEKTILKDSNVLILILYPHMNYVDQESDIPQINPIDRVFVRRPAYNYGWDFSTRALLLGIGRVTIEEEVKFNIEDIFIYTSNLTSTEAQIEIEWTCRSQSPFNALYSIGIFFKDNSITKELIQELQIGKNTTKTQIIVKNPEIWWPNGYGSPNIYSIMIREKTTNTIKSSKFGIRTIELVLEEGSKSVFYFKVNGKRIWARGANWVPTDILQNFSEDKKYQTLLNLAKDGNFNMLRIWGGGVVEKDIFYDLCDELGLMLWHDFNFACSIYPETEDFLINVNGEIREVIQRLRNHPSIILWNGNNENEWIDFQHLTPSYRELRQIGVKLHKIKAQACSDLDPSRPYWRTSPWSPSAETNYEIDPNSPNEGNRHNWEVWHGVGQDRFVPPEYEHYYNEQGKFITEYGIQSLPSEQTIEKIFSEETKKKPNEIWEFHNCDLEKLNINLRKFGKPSDIKEWILYSQIAQASAMKFAIDTWRSRKWNIGGCLIWQYNEPWPTICWSLIDYYNFPKISYWFVKRAYAPLLPIFDPKKEQIVVINDTFHLTMGSLRIVELRFPDVILKSTKTEILIEPNSKAVKSYIIDPNSELIYLEFISTKQKVTNYCLLKDPKELEIPNPLINLKIGKNPYKLILLSDKIAFVTKIDFTLNLKDNFVLIIPNEPCSIEATSPIKRSEIKISVWIHPEKIIQPQK